MEPSSTRSPPLHAFITDNLHELVGRSLERVKERNEPQPARLELGRGVELLLKQIASLLKSAANHGSPEKAEAILEAQADGHGKRLRAEGLSVGQVIHGYGDVCQVVTELAVERNTKIDAAEFRVFNECLDTAISHAVTEYSRAGERVAEGEAERVAVIARELREVLSTSMLSFDAIKRGSAGLGGSVSAMHTRSLVRLRALIDQTFTQVRVDGEPVVKERVAVSELIQEAEISAMFQARAESIGLVVSPIAANATVAVDRQMIAGALWNLLQNAFKFTRARGTVTLTSRVTEGRVFIEVSDECGGTRGEKIELMLRTPAEKNGQLRLATGLMTARQAVELNGGTLRFDNLPAIGCRFTIDLPRVD